MPKPKLELNVWPSGDRLFVAVLVKRIELSLFPKIAFEVETALDALADGGLVFRGATSRPKERGSDWPMWNRELAPGINRRAIVVKVAARLEEAFQALRKRVHIVVETPGIERRPGKTKSSTMSRARAEHRALYAKSRLKLALRSARHWRRELVELEEKYGVS